VAGIRQGLLDSPVRVATRGGVLTIEWTGDGAPVMMTGPAETVFEGEWNVPEH
jgi:diaminopimelate epimerase